MGVVVPFRATSKAYGDDRRGKRGEVIEFPRRPMAARYEWQPMDFELAQVLAAGMDAERISDGSCWALVRIKDSAAFVFLIDEGEALFTVMPADDFEAMRPELERWAPEVFSWLWRDAAGLPAKP